MAGNVATILQISLNNSLPQEQTLQLIQSIECTFFDFYSKHIQDSRIPPKSQILHNSSINSNTFNVSELFPRVGSIQTTVKLMEIIHEKTINRQAVARTRMTKRKLCRVKCWPTACFSISTGNCKAIDLLAQKRKCAKNRLLEIHDNKQTAQPTHRSNKPVEQLLNVVMIMANHGARPNTFPKLHFSRNRIKTVVWWAIAPA